MAARLGLPDLGVGIGFRLEHEDEVFRQRPPVDWWEVISENFMWGGGRVVETVLHLSELAPVVVHGTSGNLGSVDALDDEYLLALQCLVRRVDAPWATDHLCWNGVGHVHLHELLPLPLTHEAAHHVSERIKRVQDTLGVRFAIENISSYMTYTVDEMPEWAFLSLVAELADCGILLDVNNIFVSAMNHGFDAYTYIDNVPPDRVVQMHLAGHTHLGALLVDTHSRPVSARVWELYEHACRRFGRVSTLIEWDNDIPPLGVLIEQAERAKQIRNQVA